MDSSKVANHIIQWLSEYARTSGVGGFIIGVSGGIDSAVTSTLCAMTGKKTILLNMPIRQKASHLNLAEEHLYHLKYRFENVQEETIDLTSAFEFFERTMTPFVSSNLLAMANSRARLRMMTLYAVGQANHLLVVGTGNKIEDFGVGFFTKYGDGGVDLSPIADLTKTEVMELGRYLNVPSSIIEAKPTDGLWDEDRTDEEQMGATYPELEWAMNFVGDENNLNERQREVISIYHKFHNANRHKMIPIPVCEIPAEYKS